MVVINLVIQFEPVDTALAGDEVEYVLKVSFAVVHIWWRHHVRLKGFKCLNLPLERFDSRFGVLVCHLAGIVK
jgi:hypothetical protein